MYPQFGQVRVEHTLLLNFMEANHTAISVRGKTCNVPSTEIDGNTIVINGTWLRTAAIHDEDWQVTTIDDLKSLLATVQRRPLNADIFTFAQKLPDTQPQFPYHFVWDNVAAIPVTSFKEWCENRLPQETRRNVRIAIKRNVIVRPAALDDAFVEGIASIYNETPVRQGKPFWHYGKDLETIKKENSSYLNRCTFLGAFLDEELIGFLKMVYVGKTASVMQILAQNKHFDKKPVNALIAKAVEVCEEKGLNYFVYCQYVYGNNTESPLTEFKRRNGFEQILLPRYYVPLTAWGTLAVKLNLQLGVRRLLPKAIDRALLTLRARFCEPNVSKAKAPASSGP